MIRYLFAHAFQVCLSNNDARSVAALGFRFGLSLCAKTKAADNNFAGALLVHLKSNLPSRSNLCFCQQTQIHLQSTFPQAIIIPSIASRFQSLRCIRIQQPIKLPTSLCSDISDRYRSNHHLNSGIGRGQSALCMQISTRSRYQHHELCILRACRFLTLSRAVKSRC